MPNVTSRIFEHMLEHETQTIIQTLTDRTLGSAQSVALKDVLAAGLPANVKLFIRSEVMRWLQSDLKSASHFSNVRFAAPIVQHLTKMYTRTLASEYVFTREEFTTMLENATHFVENYLCRPRWTLEQFMFEKSERATPAEIQHKFECIADYMYYGKLTRGYLSLKSIREISREDFRALLTTIDDRVMKQHAPKELAQLTRPIFEFLLLQHEIAGKPIPIKPLLVFFDDKQMTTVRDYVERVCRIRNTEHLTIEQLGAIIEDLFSEPERSNKDISSQHETEPERSGLEEAAPLHDAPQSEPIPQMDKPLQQPYAENTNVPESERPEESEEEAHLAASPESVADRRNIALSLTYSGMNEKPSVTSSLQPGDLKSSIGDDQRRRFIRMIFQNDEAYYSVVIDALNGMGTWKDASLYLQMFYQASGVDPYAHDVIEFTDIIQQRYPSTPSS